MFNTIGANGKLLELPFADQTVPDNISDVPKPLTVDLYCAYKNNSVNGNPN